MKKQLFIALTFAALTGITQQASGMNSNQLIQAERNQLIQTQRKEMLELKKIYAESSKKLDALIKDLDQSNSNTNRAINDSLPSITQTAKDFNALSKKKPTYSISSINPSYAFKGTLFGIMTGVSGYTLIKMIKNCKPIMESYKGWFAIAGFGLGAFYTYKNFSNLFKPTSKK